MKYIESPELARLSRLLTHEGPECSVHTRIEAYSCKNIKRDKKLFKALEHAYTDELSHPPPQTFEPPTFFSGSYTSPHSPPLSSSGPSQSPPNSAPLLDPALAQTPFGPMDNPASRKTLYLLIATLNVAFPDHEFSDVRPDQFTKERNGATVLHALSTTLVSPQRVGTRGVQSFARSYSSYPPSSPEVFPTSSASPSISPSYSRMFHPSSPLNSDSLASGTNPQLYRLLDSVIGLQDCQVFSFSPSLDADPHANDWEDDEDDVASDSSPEDDDDEAMFEFDDYDVDESTRSRPYAPKRKTSAASSETSRSWGDSPERHGRGRSNLTLPPPMDSSPMGKYPRVHLRRRPGALLWSSHWFFFNAKLKRIVFVSSWARARAWGYDGEDEEFDEEYAAVERERFLGWEGGAGAGARALGLSATV